MSNLVHRPGQKLDASKKLELGNVTEWRPNKGPQEKFLASPATEACYGGAAGPGKALDVETPIATPMGWTTMGALRAGDELFDDVGNVCRVVHTFDVMHDRPCFEVEFSDGSTIVADVDHLWITSNVQERMRAVRCTDEWRAKRRETRPRKGTGKRPDLAERNSQSALPDYSLPRSSVRTTAEIAETLLVGTRRNHSVVVAKALHLPNASLTIDPYILGAWLGDGHSEGGKFTTADAEIVEQFERAGYEPRKTKSAYGWGTRGLHRKLRLAGLLRNKHVPREYLRASFEQRLALLQGLMDTDGCASPEDGGCEFTTTNVAIRDGFQELLATLGIKCRWAEGIATLDGRVIGPKWRFLFLFDKPAFRLKRKLSLQKLTDFRGCHDKRYIVAVRPVPTRPVRCIAVDAPSRCFLAGDALIPTHNSTALLAGATRYIHVPQYRALILRRTIPQLKRSLIPKSQEMYRGLGGVYNATDKTWTFPSGAVIQFGSIEHVGDELNYKSDEYQYIAFDELTSFEEQQYTFMFSRLRSSVGIPLRMRSATNPGDIGHDWVLRRFAPWLYPDEEHSYKGIRVKSGQLLYYVRNERTGQEQWVPKGTPGARSRTFFKALLSDNPYLAGTEYEHALDELDPVTRAQQKFGDWMARPARGAYFKRVWFEIVEVAPLIVVARVRYWDRAATPDGGDWTAGVLMSRTADGLWFVEDVIRGQWSPLEVEANIRLAAKLDPSNTRIVLEQDPAQAGKFEKEYYLRTLAGYDIHVVPPQGDTDNSKITRAKPVSAQAAAKNIRIVRGHWNEQYLRELEAFPEGHDDQVDATSGAFRQCLNTSTLLPVVGGTRVLMSGTPSLESSPYPLHSGTQRTRF